MKEHIQAALLTEQSLYLQLKEPGRFDARILDMAHEDDNCLRLAREADGRLRYHTAGLLPIGQFMEQIIFDKQEGYSFLEQLIERCILVSRAKPILLDTDYVFTTPYGDTFAFAAVPLETDAWLLQKEPTRHFIHQIRQLFRTTTAYEITGFLFAFENSREFSMPGLLQGLRDLRRQYYPKRFSFLPQKPAPAFRAREAVTPYIPAPPKENPVPEPETEEKTQILGQPEPSMARLEYNGQSFELPFEITAIGRTIANDIRIDHASVSGQHARIIRQEDRFYIQDLKSSNGTWLGEKRVQRRMRLKDGMEVRFGSAVTIFRQ